MDPTAFPANTIKNKARELGFDACGIVEASAADPENRLRRWLDEGCHADMAWLERTCAQRQDPRLLLPGAHSIVMVARGYYHPRPPAPPNAGIVARYAWGRDYHLALRKPLHHLARFMESLDAGVKTYSSLDAGAVWETVWAERAGIGWKGRHGLIILPGFGSWCFLGAILTTLPLSPDPRAINRCGACAACVAACPTKALTDTGKLDARRCISYHTIENRNEIPPEIAQRMGKRIFGCDACQEACPWNKTPVTGAADFQPRPNHANPELTSLLHLDAPAFVARFNGTPLKRTGLEGLARNAAIALNNTASLSDWSDNSPATTPSGSGDLLAERA